jgi:hypothetical protein
MSKEKEPIFSMKWTNSRVFPPSHERIRIILESGVVKIGVFHPESIPFVFGVDGNVYYYSTVKFWQYDR